jgi:hypothetical protein
MKDSISCLYLKELYMVRLDMSEQFVEGANRALAESIGGVVVAAVMSVLATLPLVQDSWGWLFAFVAAIPLIGLLAEMRLWSILYTAGWFFGIILINNSGIIPPFELALYLGVPSAIWGIRGYLWLQDGGYV